MLLRRFLTRTRLVLMLIVALVVAIPAVWMFNYFTNRVDGFVVDMNDVSSELVDYILKEGRTATR